MRNDYTNKIVWITGTSSGMGKEVAFRFAEAGARLILTALEPDLLDQVREECLRLGAPAVTCLPCDLSQTDALPQLAEEAWNAYGGLNLLYNNAGISQRGTTVETDMAVIRKVMDIDFYAPVILTKAVLPKMIEQGGGQLAVTTSIAGLFGFPLRCAYSSAKHALYGFFETVAAENYANNIRVTILTPGRVQTNISVNALEKDGRQHGKMDAGQAGGITAEKASRIIFKAIANERREKLVGSSELIMAHIKRFFPGLCAKLVRKIKPM